MLSVFLPPHALAQRGIVEKGEKPKVLTDRHGDPLPAHAIGRLGTIRWQTSGLLSYDPDGKTLISFGRRGVSRLDAKSGQLLNEQNAPTGEWPLCVQSFGDGRSLALSVTDFFKKDVPVFLKDLSTGKELIRFDSGQFLVMAGAISADGKTAASGHFDIRLWETATGKEIRKLKGPKIGTYSLAFSANGELLAAGAGPEPGYVGKPLPAEILIMEAASGRVLHSLQGHHGRVPRLAFSPDGKTLVSSGQDGQVRQWDVMTGKELRTWHKEDTYALAFSPDGKILALSTGAGQIYRLDMETGKELARPDGHSDSVYAVAFAPGDGVIASGSSDHTLRLWDSKTGKQHFQMAGYHHEYCADSLAITPDGKVLASSDEGGGVSLWDLVTHKRLQQWKPTAKEARPWFVAFMQEGKLLAIGSRRTIQFWDVPLGKEVKKTDLGGTALTSLTGSSKAKVLAAGESDGAVSLWDVTTGKVIRRLGGKDRRKCVALSFSANGKVLASSLGGQELQLWDIDSGKELRRIALPGARESTTESSALALSPNGKIVASVAPQAAFEDIDPDYAILVYEAMTGKQIGQLKGHTSKVTALTFSDDGRTLGSGSHDSTVLIWDLTKLMGRDP